MPSVIVNAQGTTCSSFSIGKRGVVIYQGSIAPSDTLGNNGDVYIKRGQDCKMLIKNNNIWETVGTVQGSGKAVSSITTSQTIDLGEVANENIFIVDTSSGALDLTLSTSSLVSGNQVTIKDGTGNSLINNIRIHTEGTATIDGDDSVTINSNFTSLTLICDGTNWYII